MLTDKLLQDLQQQPPLTTKRKNRKNLKIVKLIMQLKFLGIQILMFMKFK